MTECKVQKEASERLGMDVSERLGMELFQCKYEAIVRQVVQSRGIKKIRPDPNRIEIFRSIQIRSVRFRLQSFLEKERRRREGRSLAAVWSTLRMVTLSCLRWLCGSSLSSKFPFVFALLNIFKTWEGVLFRFRHADFFFLYLLSESEEHPIRKDSRFV